MKQINMKCIWIEKFEMQTEAYTCATYVCVCWCMRGLHGGTKSQIIIRTKQSKANTTTTTTKRE